MIAYTKSQVKNYTPFDLLDPIQKSISNIYSKEIKKLIKDKSSNIKVLDYACGPGRYLDYFPSDILVDFIDPSSFAIKILREKILSKGSDKFHKAICSKIESINYSYDIIFSFGLIGEHIPLNEFLLNLFINRLKPKSKLVISIDLLNPKSNSFLRSLRDIADTNLRLYSIKLPIISSNRSMIPEIIKYINNEKVLSYDIYPLISPYLNPSKLRYRHCILEINVK